MAVEATHMNIFPQQLIRNSDLINTNHGNTYPYNIQMVSSGHPLPEALLPFHQSQVCNSILQANTSMKADSGLTYNIPAPRKRSRDSLDQYTTFASSQKKNLSPFSSVLDENISLQIRQHQLEIDNVIAQHTKKIKMELEEGQNQQARLLVTAIGEGVMKKLKEKDDQIQRMDKLNLVLQERVKSLYIENQLWRDMAHTNEVTANYLRNNLEQVLVHVSDQRLWEGVGVGVGGERAEVEEDVESCCGDNDSGRDIGEDVIADPCTLAGGDIERRMLICEAQDNKVVVVGGGGGDKCMERMCRKCGKRESCVLLLPCRHLCLCTMCGSTVLLTCPVCNSNMNATLHLNMS